MANQGKSCRDRWPESKDGEYDPRCCRFPKSCSAGLDGEERGEESVMIIEAPVPQAGQVMIMVSDGKNWKGLAVDSDLTELADVRNRVLVDLLTELDESREE